MLGEYKSAAPPVVLDDFVPLVDGLYNYAFHVTSYNLPSAPLTQHTLTGVSSAANASPVADFQHNLCLPSQGVNHPKYNTIIIKTTKAIIHHTKGLLNHFNTSDSPPANPPAKFLLYAFSFN